MSARVGIDQAEGIPLSHGAIALHDRRIVELRDNFRGAEDAADHGGAVDEVEGAFHSWRIAADEHGIFIFRQRLFPGHEEVRQFAPGADAVGNFKAQFRGDVRGIGDEVHDGVVLFHRDAVQAAICGVRQRPHVFRHAGVQVGRQLFNFAIEVGEQALRYALIEVVVPGAGIVNVVYFAGLDGELNLVVGEILDVAFHADGLAAHFVEFFQHHGVVDGGHVARAHGPGQLDGFAFRARKRGHRQHHQQSEDGGHEFLHKWGTSFFLFTTAKPL